MLLRLVALGAAGYAGYKYLTQARAERAPYPAQQAPGAHEPAAAAPDVAVAGGPLSGEATLIHKGEDLPT